LLMTIVLAAMLLGVNYRINAFGVFGDVHGKAYRSYLNEDREAKYLFSLNYIPENFDGVLIGSSISGNWDTRKLQLARTYNLSIDGANITEEKIIAENVFAREKVRVAIFCVYPYMVTNHGKKTAYMQPRDYWNAWGSTLLFREYLNRILARMGRRKFVDDEFGVRDQSGRERHIDPVKADDRRAHREEIVLDETSVAEYAALLEEARAQGAYIIGFIPPHYSGIWNGDDYGAFLARMKGLFRADEKIIDFNEAEYEQFRNNRDYFYDGVHISTSGADFLASELNSRLMKLHTR
jgi:hypothetical protein